MKAALFAALFGVSASLTHGSVLTTEYLGVAGCFYCLPTKALSFLR